MQKVTFVIENREQHDYAAKCLQKWGYREAIHEGYNPERHGNICGTTDGFISKGPFENAIGGLTCVGSSEGYRVVDLREFSVDPIKLTGNYWAIVTPTVVRVGCQRFPHSVVLKLAEAIQAKTYRPLGPEDILESTDEQSWDKGKTWVPMDRSPSGRGLVGIRFGGLTMSARYRRPL